MNTNTHNTQTAAEASNLSTPALSTIDFPVWKTIEIGNGLKTVEDFRAAYNRPDLRSFLNVTEVMAHPSFTVARQLTKVELVRVSLEELGYIWSTGDKALLERRTEIMDLAKAKGLELCTVEAAIQLRLQYRGDDYILIGTEPVPYTAGDGSERVCTLGIDEGTICCYIPDWVLGGDWVFVKPRKGERQ